MPAVDDKIRVAAEQSWDTPHPGENLENPYLHTQMYKLKPAALS